ncbi:MAG: threonylcarbamoyl-AMP synthase [Acidiferrobacterales bacterium]|nr:threonylcarbamoyl-AMP synthase [Acidiferrobacterales bacterium]
MQSIQSWQLKQAARAIRAGAIVAYPTEAVFGLGCDPENLEAVWRLLALKQRPVEKGLILIAASFGQLAPYLAPVEKDIEKKVLASWPGPVTWLLPARDDVSPLLRGAHNTIAVRVTAHPVARALCQALGHPLVSTSANIANGRPARDALTVRRLFGDSIDYLVPGRVGDLKRPTEIRDARSDSVVRA